MPCFQKILRLPAAWRKNVWQRRNVTVNWGVRFGFKTDSLCLRIVIKIRNLVCIYDDDGQVFPAEVYIYIICPLYFGVLGSIRKVKPHIVEVECYVEPRGRNVDNDNRVLPIIV